MAGGGTLSFVSAASAAGVLAFGGCAGGVAVPDALCASAEIAPRPGTAALGCADVSGRGGSGIAFNTCCMPAWATIAAAVASSSFEGSSALPGSEVGFAAVVWAPAGFAAGAPAAAVPESRIANGESAPVLACGGADAAELESGGLATAGATDGIIQRPNGCCFALASPGPAAAGGRISGFHGIPPVGRGGLATRMARHELPQAANSTRGRSQARCHFARVLRKFRLAPPLQSLCPEIGLWQ
jgi:hypothetical protein